MRNPPFRAVAIQKKSGYNQKMKTGTALLPLHGGRAPAWLFSRMVGLSREITRVIVQDFGPREVLVRLSDPYWFQAFGCILGFDWHSSGVTTTVCGALKEGWAGLGHEIGLFAAGGKGRTSRKTPFELEEIGAATGLDTAPHRYASRMSAKVDNTAVQDGYQLYHHSFFISKDGSWAVVQQGMNAENRYARRYHWFSERVRDFVCEPHAAICGPRAGPVLNLVAGESAEARVRTAEIASQHPDRVVGELKKLQHLTLPRHHAVGLENIHPQRIYKTLLPTYENPPRNFESLIGTLGVGPKTLRALALISELVYGTEASRRDPARFSFAHGGKDGHPYPVDRAAYDRSIEVLRHMVQIAKIGQVEKRDALKRLHELPPPTIPSPPQADLIPPPPYPASIGREGRSNSCTEPVQKKLF